MEQSLPGLLVDCKQFQPPYSNERQKADCVFILEPPSASLIDRDRRLIDNDDPMNVQGYFDGIPLGRCLAYATLSLEYKKNHTVVRRPIPHTSHTEAWQPAKPK